MATQITYDEHTKGYIEGMSKAIEIVEAMGTTAAAWSIKVAAPTIADRLKREVPSV